jgi:tetratricopeptide (TPR) repeat protein
MHLDHEEEEYNLSLSKFESMLKTNKVLFFDSEEFEEIILHYLDIGKATLAKKALKLALEQHPKSTGLKLVQVEMLVYDDKLDQAEKLLNELYAIEPTNEEIFIQKANIYSKREKPRTIKLDFLPYKERLKNVIILNEDYRDVINNFNYKDAFFYLDPPYEVAIDNLKYYKHHSVYPSDILKICKTIKGRFLLSYNDSANIRKLFKDFYIYELKIAYNTNKDTNLIKTELLITNYTLS